MVEVDSILMLIARSQKCPLMTNEQDLVSQGQVMECGEGVHRSKQLADPSYYDDLRETIKKVTTTELCLFVFLPTLFIAVYPF
jgi:hypothetical protein